MSKPLIIAMVAFVIFPGALGYHNYGAPARAVVAPEILLPAGAVPAGQWKHRPGLGDYNNFIKQNK